MKHQITLKEIAKELGVSISTVSKSLKNSKEISLETREKIQAFAKLYNYKPNNIALSLKNRKTYILGIVIPEIVHHFFSSVIKGIEDVAISRGYTVVISVSNEEYKKETTIVQALSNGTVDGFIVSLSKETLFTKNFSHLQKAVDLEIPIVMFDRVTTTIKCDNVVVDDRNISMQSVSFLIEKGHKRIAFITTEDYLTVGKLRTNGYYDALKQNNILIDESLIIRIGTQTDIYEAIDQLFLNHKIDAIVTVNDLFAAACIKMSKRHQIKCPDDISILSLSDGIVCEYTNPSITAINQNGFLMGKKSATLLIERIESKTNDKYVTETIPTDLILRESVINRRPDFS